MGEANNMMCYVLVLPQYVVILSSRLMVDEEEFLSLWPMLGFDGGWNGGLVWIILSRLRGLEGWASW